MVLWQEAADTQDMTGYALPAGNHVRIDACLVAAWFCLSRILRRAFRALWVFARQVAADLDVDIEAYLRVCLSVRVTHPRSCGAYTFGLTDLS